jgi:hypothetical protein
MRTEQALPFPITIRVRVHARRSRLPQFQTIRRNTGTVVATTLTYHLVDGGGNHDDLPDPTVAGVLPAVSSDLDLVTSGRLSMAKILVISYTSPRGSK